MMGTTIHHCGDVGTGMRTKLVNNYLAIILCQLNAEALALFGIAGNSFSVGIAWNTSIAVGWMISSSHTMWIGR